MSEPHLIVRAEDRDDPDLRRLARALIDLAIAQSEAAETEKPAADEQAAA